MKSSQQLLKLEPKRKRTKRARRAQRRINSEIVYHGNIALRLFYKQPNCIKSNSNTWHPASSNSNWGSFTSTTMTTRPLSILPFDWNIFFTPNGFRTTKFNILNSGFKLMLDYVRLNQLTNVSYLYRHMVVNSTWSVSKFYSHHSISNILSKNYLDLSEGTSSQLLLSNLTKSTLNTEPLYRAPACQAVKTLKTNLLTSTNIDNLTRSKKKMFSTQQHLSWTRKLLFYFTLRRNFRSFKASSYVYRTRRYVYWSYREFAGSHWRYTNPGYHQSFYEALRLSGTFFHKPDTFSNPVSQSRGLFYLQLYGTSDLVAESQFSNYTGVVVSNMFETTTNWRSTGGVQRSLMSLLHNTLMWATKSASITTSWEKRLCAKKYTNTVKSSRNRRKPKKLIKLPFSERNQFLKSIKQSTARFLVTLLNNITSVFKFYTPLKLNLLTNSELEYENTDNVLRPTSVRKNLNLLQMYPTISKEMFNHNFFFKYTMTQSSLNHYSTSRPSLFTHDYLFSPNLLSTTQQTNITPSASFNYHIGRRLVKSFAVSKLLPKVTPWYLTNLVRFVEYCSGRKVAIRLEPFLANHLTFTDTAKCAVWIGRILGFQKILGPKFFLDEMLKAMTLALKAKDATFLSNWIRGMLKRLSFWKMRVFFRFIKYIMRYVFWSSFDYFQFKGMKICLKGKISVAGNARTRTLLYRIGSTSYSKFDNKVSHDFSCIGTFTGVMGFRIWLFF